MKVFFQTSKLKKIAEDIKQLRREYGQIQAEKIVMRVQELRAAEALLDISKLPQTGLHPLSGNFKGCFAVNLKQPYRMIFYPLNGEVDKLAEISEITIKKLCHDYH